MTVTVRYFAAARAATGVSVEEIEGGTMADVLGAVADRHGGGVSALLGSSSFLLDGVSIAPNDARELGDGATVDVLPPFAGG